MMKKATKSSFEDCAKNNAVNCPVLSERNENNGFVINMIKESDDGSYSVVLVTEGEIPEMKDPGILHYKIQEKEYLPILNEHKHNNDSSFPKSDDEDKNIICDINEPPNHLIVSESDDDRKNIITDNYSGPYIKDDVLVKKKSKEMLYCCPVENCNRKFFHFGTYRQHQLLHDAESYKCKYCDKVEPDFDRLKTHESKHFDDKGNQILFHCMVPDCDKNFCSLSLLRRHELSHDLSSQPFVCEPCGKSFSTKYKIKRHLRFHTDNLPYSCSECGKCFRSLYVLNQHRKGHWSVGKFVCNLCGAEFNKPGNLKRHQQVHKSKKYICKVCKSSYNYARSLTKHMAKAHPIANSKEIQAPSEKREKKNIITYLKKLRNHFKT